MKTIGLIGGMSWESTATYYKEINQGIKKWPPIFGHDFK